MAKKNKINCDAILINRLIKIRFNILRIVFLCNVRVCTFVHVSHVFKSFCFCFSNLTKML